MLSGRIDFEIAVLIHVLEKIGHRDRLLSAQKLDVKTAQHRRKSHRGGIGIVKRVRQTNRSGAGSEHGLIGELSLNHRQCVCGVDVQSQPAGDQREENRRSHSVK